jgi:CheY-like chemotaxis protein
MQADDEDELLRSVAIQNAQSILAARQRAEQEILRAKEEVERASQELAHSLAMMRATLESTWDGILVTDEHGNVMPDVDGYELLRRVRGLGHTRGGRIPAIALTAFARSEDRTGALRAGFLVQVSKPVEPSELVATWPVSWAGRARPPPSSRDARVSR